MTVRPRVIMMMITVVIMSLLVSPRPLWIIKMAGTGTMMEGGIEIEIEIETEGVEDDMMMTMTTSIEE